MLIQELPISSLNPAPYNPRKDLKPSDPEYQKLAKSIQQFELVEPLIWNKRTGNLVGGHQRLKVITDLGFEKVHVSVVDMDLKQEKALNVALNKHAGAWDFQKLRTLLVEDLDDGDMDLEVTGFDEAELKQLVDWQPSEQKGADAVGSTPEDRLNGFLNNNIKQIVLYFKADQYEDVVKRLESVCGAEGVADNTEAVMILLDFYETRRPADKAPIKHPEPVEVA